MNRETYLSQPHVGEFVKWLERRLDSSSSFPHEYVVRKTGEAWQCESLYDAYTKYRWKFSCRHPVTREHVSGQHFEETAGVFRTFQTVLRSALCEGDNDLCRVACLGILEWGGVLLGNGDYITRQKESLVTSLSTAAKHLQVDSYVLGTGPTVRITSGFSKIYSLLLDDFIIYDSRVAAALCLMITQYCEENLLPVVPKPLQFRIGPSRTAANRNPNRGNYIFKALTYGGNDQYLDNNMRANWLLKAAVAGTDSEFSRSGHEPLLALQAAMFMIGYDVGSTY